MSDGKKEIAFEDGMKKLETIVQNLENGDLSLEAALKAYEEGVQIAEICSRRLQDAEKKVEVLMKTTGGKFKTEPFNEEGASAKPKKKK